MQKKKMFYSGLETDIVSFRLVQDVLTSSSPGTSAPTIGEDENLDISY